MNYHPDWLVNLGSTTASSNVDGLVSVDGYVAANQSAEEVIAIEKAKHYGADAVFFEAPLHGRGPQAQAFVYFKNIYSDVEFAKVHKQLWNWGGVPLVYRKKPGAILLYRCVHKPDFLSDKGELVSEPIKILTLAAEITTSEPWWNSGLLRNGTFWDRPDICSEFLSSSKSAHRSLITAVASLYNRLDRIADLNPSLRRRLLILSLLTAYLEERKAFPDDFFSNYIDGAEKFFQVLRDGPALVRLLSDLEKKFNGHIFSFADDELSILSTGVGLNEFSDLIEAKTEVSGQLSLWDLYSFQDLPVEVISHIYQLFVEDSSSSIYTPHFLVQLILDEVLSPERIERLNSKNEIILDPACGSGIFLVEAYKRLILHWRASNDWENPDVVTLQALLQKVHGVDLDEGAVELTAFSLCLCLCDSLQPETLRSSEGLFPSLMGKTIHHSCFFEAKQNSLLELNIGVIIGNPPFESKLKTAGAQVSYNDYNNGKDHLPDKQVAYLFIHESMKLLALGGILGMLQSANFLYNLNSKKFRQKFLNSWNVREILDFISVRGLFTKAGGDTKVVTVIAESIKPKGSDEILHVTFRRTGRTKAQQSFDINHYDLHRIPQNQAVIDCEPWRSNIMGGKRMSRFSERLSQYSTLKDYAQENGWDYGEGFIAGNASARLEADYLTGQKLLPTTALSTEGIDKKQIQAVESQYFASPRNPKRFQAPLLLIKRHMDLHHDIWRDSYLTYKDRIIGFSASSKDGAVLAQLNDWLSTHKREIKAFAAMFSPSLFIQKATAIDAHTIFSIPYPQNGDLDLSENEKILVDDIIDFYRDFVRFGEDQSKPNLAHAVTDDELEAYNTILTNQINGIYKDNPLKPVSFYRWPGAICHSYVFGNGTVDWRDAEGLKSKLNTLLYEQIGSSLHVTRVARIYDDHFVHILKPQNIRYWLKSVALQDSDEIMSDLRSQGF